MKLLNFPSVEDTAKQGTLARKALMVEVLQAMIEMVENDEITEFVATSLDGFGDAQIHVCTADFMGGIGMFEIGKNTFMTMNMNLDSE